MCRVMIANVLKGYGIKKKKEQNNTIINSKSKVLTNRITYVKAISNYDDPNVIILFILQYFIWQIITLKAVHMKNKREVITVWINDIEI